MFREICADITVKVQGNKININIKGKCPDKDLYIQISNLEIFMKDANHEIITDKWIMGWETLRLQEHKKNGYLRFSFSLYNKEFVTEWFSPS